MTPEKPETNPEPIKPKPKLKSSEIHVMEPNFQGSGGFKPLAEIKSSLFGNISDEESDETDDETDPMNLRDEFLKESDEYQTVKKGKKKHGRKSSTENSDSKHKKKGNKAAKYNN